MLLLHDDDYNELRESFKDQLTREFSAENYLFYFATLHFEAAFDINSNRRSVFEEGNMTAPARAALDIYQEFLVENARNEVSNATFQESACCSTCIMPCMYACTRSCNYYAQNCKDAFIVRKVHSWVSTAGCVGHLP